MITRHMRKAMFEVLTADNSQHVTLNDNAGRVPSEAIITAQGSLPVWMAIRSYARRHSISPRDVGYACRPCKPEEVRAAFIKGRIVITAE